MKKILLFSVLLISVGAFSQTTKTPSQLTQKNAAFTDTLIAQNSTTQATTLQKVFNLFHSGTTSQYMRGDGSFATFPTIPDSTTLAAKYYVDTAKVALRAQIATLSGGGITAANFITGEAPTGTKNGSNTAFALAFTPVSGSERLFVNGVRQKRGTDYTISGTAITMIIAPRSTDDLLTDYIK